MTRPTSTTPDPELFYPEEQESDQEQQTDNRLMPDAGARPTVPPSPGEGVTEEHVEESGLDREEV